MEAYLNSKLESCTPYVIFFPLHKKIIYGTILEFQKCVISICEYRYASLNDWDTF